MTKRDVMKRAHEIARLMVGDYAARMSYGLRKAWEEARGAVAYEVAGRGEIVVRAAGCLPARLRLNRWTKYGKDRLYVSELRARVEKKYGYLDLLTWRFVWEMPYTNPRFHAAVEAAVKHYARRSAA